MLEVLVLGVRMSEINPVGNISIIPSKRNINFKAAGIIPADNDYDVFIKKQQKEQKNAKRKQNIMTGLQAGALLAIIASVFVMLRNGSGMGKKTSELKEIWSDLGKSSKLDDLALPDSLKKFTASFKNSVENPTVLKNRGGKPTKSVLMYGPPGTGKTTFAKALAKEFPDSKFASLDVTSLGSEYQSVSERNLNKAVDMICKEADNNPSKKFFVFIDEIDSVMMVDNSLSAKHSNDMLNEFKKCFTEKLGKRDNIITIGATNLPIDVEKGIALGGKKLDRPMLDRFSEKVLVDLPTKEQIINSVKFHYKDSSLVSDKLKTDSAELKAIAEFLSKKEHNTSTFLSCPFIEAAVASYIASNVLNDVIDIVNTIRNKQHEMNFTDAEFAKLLSDLKV